LAEYVLLLALRNTDLFNEDGIMKDTSWTEENEIELG
jgi:hypothetical protein